MENEREKGRKGRKIRAERRGEREGFEARSKERGKDRK